MLRARAGGTQFRRSRRSHGELVIRWVVSVAHGHRRALTCHTDDLDRGGQQALRRAACAQEHQPRRPAWAGPGGARAVRVGQVDVVPHHQPAGDHRLGLDHHRRPAAARRGTQAGPAALRGRHGVPVVQPVRAQDDPGERHAGADEGAQEEQGRGARARRWSCWSGSGSPLRPTSIRRSSPAVSSSGWRSPGRWRWTPR